LIVTAVGLVCAAAGLYGVIDSASYGIRGERVDATVVDVEWTGGEADDILEFAVSGRQYRTKTRGSFGVIWGPGHGLRSRVVPILFGTVVDIG